MLFRSLCSLYFLTSLSRVDSGPDFSGIVEVDYIFSRDSATYPYLEPCPVVFAMQHTEILYTYGFQRTQLPVS